MKRTTAIDKIWIQDFESELNSQNNVWKSQTLPQPKKFYHSQSKVKQMMIFVYDKEKIIMIDPNAKWYYCD